MGVAEKSTKVETLLKIQLGRTPTGPVMEGIEREEKPPRLPTPGRAVLESAGQKCRPSKRSAEQGEDMIVAWTRVFYRRV